MAIFLYLSLLLLFQNCHKKDIPIPIEPPTLNKSKLQVVWQKPLGLVDTTIHLSAGPTLINDKVAIGTGEGTQFRNKTTGQFLFNWKDWLSSSFYYTSQGQVIGQNLFINDETEAYLINSENGQTIWSSNINHGVTRANVVWGNAYQAHGNKVLLYNDYNNLTRINTNTGKRDTILTINKVNSYEIEAEPPAGWISPNGDSLLIFLVRGIDFGGTLDTQLDMYAYNMTADSIEWKLIDFDPEGNAKVGPPLIEGDLVWFAGERIFYCLNAADGSLVWKRRFDDDTNGFSEILSIAAFIKIGEHLVLSPTNENTYCFNAYTGEELWKKTNSASSPKNMVHHKGIIYTVGRGEGRLFAIDIETGEHLWRERPPNHYLDSRATFSNRVTLDPDSEYLYLDDGFFLLCIKLIER
jgi:outer membrane protein assembly factor BamB